MYSACCFHSILTKLHFGRQILQVPNMKVRPAGLDFILADGQAHRRNEAGIRLCHWRCERAWKNRRYSFL